MFIVTPALRHIHPPMNLKPHAYRRIYTHAYTEVRETHRVSIYAIDLRAFPLPSRISFSRYGSLPYKRAILNNMLYVFLEYYVCPINVCPENMHSILFNIVRL